MMINISMHMDVDMDVDVDVSVDAICTVVARVLQLNVIRFVHT